MCVASESPMDTSIYDDGTISVTRTEIRTNGFVQYLDNVSSISINTVRPWKRLTPLLALATVAVVGLIVIMNALFTSAFSSVHAQDPTGAFILLLVALSPFCAMGAVAFFLRISRLLVLTSGGPVILASKVTLTDPYETIARYKEIKRSIEKAISLRRR